MPWRFWESRDVRIARAAARWRAEMLEPVSPATHRRFESWLSADPAHLAAYRELDPFTELAIRLPSPARGVSARLHVLRPAFGLAIFAALVVGGALLLTGRAAPPAFAEVVNAGPAVRHVRLADGSGVVLDARTKLAVRIDSKARRIRLESGRARVAVAANSARPLVMCSRVACVQSAGGIVDLAVDDDYPEVVAIRGAAKLLSTDASSRQAGNLASGDAIRIEANQVRPAQVSRFQRFWPSGRAQFDEASLSTIVAAANRLGGPPIRLASDTLGTLRVTAVLDLRDTRALAEKLAAALHLSAQRTHDGIVLAR
jgi:transmembrane sensor